MKRPIKQMPIRSFLSSIFLLVLTTALFSCGKPEAVGGARSVGSVGKRPVPPPLEGEILSDLGFRPAIDGFSFPNYSNDGVVNLTEAEMHRLFGDDAFEIAEDGSKILAPTAREWMEVVNDAMNGGHCEGLAVGSLLLYAGRLDPRKFGGSSVGELQKDGNEALQREIALWWATQVTTPTSESRIFGSPSEIVELLINGLGKSGSENPLYDLHIYARDGGGGHAITPFAIRSRDAKIVEILCYDNNHPGEIRAVVVDREANTWSYQASRNPDEAETEYVGDASTQSLIAVPASPRLQTQESPFDDYADFSEEDGEEADEESESEEDEEEVASAKPAAASDAKSPVEFWLDGDADLLITDKQGRKLGIHKGKMVNEIPGASIRYMLSGGFEKVEHEPVYTIPAGIAVTISLSGARLDEATASDLSIFGPGYSIEVNEVTLEPGQVDRIDFSPDGRSVTYRPSGEESPDLIISFRTRKADYEFEVSDFEVSKGGAIEMGIEYKEGRVRIRAPGSSDGATLGLYGYRIANGKEEQFENDDVMLEKGETGYLHFRDWDGAGDSMKFTLDSNGDGKWERETDLNDENLARE